MEKPADSKERLLARRVLQQLEEKGLLDRGLANALLAEVVQWLLNHDPTLRGQLLDMLRRYQEQGKIEDPGPVN